MIVLCERCGRRGTMGDRIRNHRIAKKWYLLCFDCAKTITDGLKKLREKE